MDFIDTLNSPAYDSLKSAAFAGASKNVIQMSHGFIVGDVLYWNSDSAVYDKAKNGIATKDDVIYMVINVTDVNSFTIIQNGYVSGIAVEQWALYYLSDTTPGQITKTEPTATNSDNNVVFASDSATGGYFFSWRADMSTSAPSIGVGSYDANKDGVIDLAARALAVDWSVVENKPPDTTTTANINDSTNKRFVTDAQRTVIQNTSGINSGDETNGSILSKLNITSISGVNTGDETGASIKSKLGITVISGSNTGDQDLSGLVPKTTTINGHNLTGNITLSPSDVSAQPTLISGSNIKTIEGTSLLGSGNIAVDEILVSGTNIKTICGNTLVGAGDIDLKTIGGVSLIGGGDIPAQLSAMDSYMMDIGNMSNNLFYNSDGSLNYIMYENGYKELYEYTNGNVTSVKYFDTDSITLLYTLTVSYDSNNNILGTTWG